MDSLFIDGIIEKAQEIADALSALPLEERIAQLNAVRRVLHEVSPFQREPVDCVEWVPGEKIEGNEYNPNRVAPPEMKLLRRSIREDGYTQPIVGFRENGKIEVVDGFHRNRVGKEDRKIRERLHGHLPVTVINADRCGKKDRMAATIRHNRARGVHGVAPMTELVAALIKAGWDDSQVAEELGMDADEVLRFKQNSGLPELFKDGEFSRAWE